jgi:hypothetical protein
MSDSHGDFRRIRPVGKMGGGCQKGWLRFAPGTQPEGSSKKHQIGGEGGRQGEEEEEEKEDEEEEEENKMEEEEQKMMTKKKKKKRKRRRLNEGALVTI